MLTKRFLSVLFIILFPLFLSAQGQNGISIPLSSFYISEGIQLEASCEVREQAKGRTIAYFFKNDGSTSAKILIANLDLLAYFLLADSSIFSKDLTITVRPAADPISFEFPIEKQPREFLIKDTVLVWNETGKKWDGNSFGLSKIYVPVL
jgi:hypothetical protein